MNESVKSRTESLPNGKLSMDNLRATLMSLEGVEGLFQEDVVMVLRLFDIARDEYASPRLVFLKVIAEAMHARNDILTSCLEDLFLGLFPESNPGIAIKSLPAPRIAANTRMKARQIFDSNDGDETVCDDSADEIPRSERETIPAGDPYAAYGSQEETPTAVESIVGRIRVAQKNGTPGRPRT
jgi:hypothetical protein